MLIDFEKLEAAKVENFRGGEKYIMVKTAVDDGDNKIMLSRVVPGGSVGMHAHETNCEVIYFVSGTGVSILDGVEQPLYPGLVQYCEKGHTHSIINNGTEDLVFFAVVPNIK